MVTKRRKMNSYPTSNINQTVPFDHHAERLQRREARRLERESGNRDNWIAGLMITGMGVILLMQTLGIYTLRNWWALFILLPAIGAFTAAWKAYQSADGHLTLAARGALIGGLFLTTIAVAFMFNLNLTIVGPLLLILAGLGLILNFVARR
jgi:hypothetical protein